MKNTILAIALIASVGCEREVCWQCHRYGTTERYPVCGTADELQDLEDSLNRRDTTFSWVCE